jgi:NAD-dependent SIR2 family protein deacetylase
MGQITRKETYGMIGSEHEPEISLCPKCKKQGWDSILREKVYLPGESIPRDHDLWKQ